MNHYESPEHPIPGVKYVPEVRTRMVETTIGGKTRLTPEEYTVQVMVHPIDWDRIIMRGVMGVTLGATALTVSWTMASVGGLLARHVPDAIGYGVATVLDSVWLACIGLEWVERRDPERARPAMIGGWIALALSMGAIITDGLTMPESYGAAIGGIGAAIALTTKGLWWLVKRRFHVPLSGNADHFLRQERQEIAARRAVAADLAEFAREQAYTKAVYGEAADDLSVTVNRPAAAVLPAAPAYALGPAVPVSPAVAPVSRPVPQMSPAVAVPVPAAAPATPAPAADQQGHGGNTVSPAVAPVVPGLVPVPSGLAPNPAPEPPVYVQAPLPEQPPAPPVAPVQGIETSMAATVRDVLAEAGAFDLDLNAAGVLDAVQKIVTPRVQAAHPDKDHGARSIRRTIQREHLRHNQKAKKTA